MIFKYVILVINIVRIRCVDMNGRTDLITATEKWIEENIITKTCNVGLCNREGSRESG